MQSAANDYLIDREAQRNDVIYTGITHIAMQDQAITESMGEIVDHSFEHLAPSDQMITRTRRRLLMAARALREKSAAPPCVGCSRKSSGRCAAARRCWRRTTGRRRIATGCSMWLRPTGWREAAE